MTRDQAWLHAHMLWVNGMLPEACRAIMKAEIGNVDIPRERATAPAGLKIRFCVTAFKRWKHLQASLPLNICLVKHYPHVRFHIVLFTDGGTEDDYALQKFRTLLISSRLNLDKVDFYLCHIRHWDAPACKNTAHRVAMESLDSQPCDILVNLDCDNVITSAFVDALSLQLNGHHPAKLQCWRGQDGGVTGRVTLSAALFKELNGYDEDLRGAGYQDMDLRDRACLLKRVQKSYGMAGFSIANDLQEVERGRSSCNAAKMENLDPRLLEQHRSWGKLNEYNRALSKRKSDGGIIARNVTKAWSELGFPASPFACDATGTMPIDDCTRVVPRDCVRGRKLTFGSVEDDESRKLSRTSGLSDEEWTFHVVGLSLIKDCPAKRMIEARRGPNGTLAHALLHQALNVQLKELPITVNCGVLFDPEGSIRGHVGTNPEIVKRVSQHPNFMTLLKTLAEEMPQSAQILSEPQIVFTCSKGRHRSVAMALIMQHIVEACGGTARIIYYNRGDWWRVCNGCSECFGPSEARSERLAWVRARWLEFVDARWRRIQ